MPDAARVDGNDRLTQRRLRIVERPKLRVADVAMFYGERSGGIRTYLDEKVRWAQRESLCEHHLIVPGAHEYHQAAAGSVRHELRALRVAAANGYRIPAGSRSLQATLRLVRPDIVLFHDPFWRPLQVGQLVREAGGKVVMVHHGSAALDAGAFPGPQPLYTSAFRAWLRRTYAPADAVMSACDPSGDAGRGADLELRFGLHPAFRPRRVARGDHVLYVGRLAREKGIFTLLDATAGSRDSWPLELLGAGPAVDAVKAHVRRLGLSARVTFRQYVSDRRELAASYAAARCVVMPGANETFGLVAFEAAASGASTVACATAPSAALLGPLAHTFAPDDPGGLLAAIEVARASRPDHEAAAHFADRHTWQAAFRAELADLEGLAR
ncbi:MAG: glycosyltransferase [Solirubrobacterales bacterium]|nr:glycosyltransferase [Solirubrobacterales bacterium]